MKKMVLLLTLILSTLVFGKVGGCILAQKGDVTLSYNDKKIEKVNYTPAKKEGKNFKEILVGSTFTFDGKKLVILDIKANKRLGKGPRTGVMKLSLDKKEFDAAYFYNKGDMKVEGFIVNKKVIFWLHIEAVLCFK